MGGGRTGDSAGVSVLSNQTQGGKHTTYHMHYYMHLAPMCCLCCKEKGVPLSLGVGLCVCVRVRVCAPELAHNDVTGVLVHVTVRCRHGVVTLTHLVGEPVNLRTQEPGVLDAIWNMVLRKKKGCRDGPVLGSLRDTAVGGCLHVCGCVCCRRREVHSSSSSSSNSFMTCNVVRYGWS